MKLYLFDFDGTLTTRDTLFDFLKFTAKELSVNYYIGFTLFAPFFILSKLKIMDSGKVKERFIAYFLKDKTKLNLANLAKKYFDQSNYLIHPKAKTYLADLQNKKVDRYIVSASVDIWVQPFADYYDMRLICTKALYQNEIFMGKFSSENCNNEAKKQRILNEISLDKYTEIIAFGDTSGDMAMFSLAHKTYFRHFN